MRVVAPWPWPLPGRQRRAGAAAPRPGPHMSAISREAATLIRTQRWAALATADAGGPFASMVAYAIEPSGTALLFHVSQLAQHTRNLLEHSRCSLVISEPDTSEGDPQRLQRVTLTGYCVGAAPEGRGLPRDRGGVHRALSRRADALRARGLSPLSLHAGGRPVRRRVCARGTALVGGHRGERASVSHSMFG